MTDDGKTIVKWYKTYFLIYIRLLNDNYLGILVHIVPT